jgi:hypothetical protein
MNAVLYTLKEALVHVLQYCFWCVIVLIPLYMMIIGVVDLEAFRYAGF